MKAENLERLARVCHEARRVVLEASGDFTVPAWGVASLQVRERERKRAAWWVKAIEENCPLTRETCEPEREGEIIAESVAPLLFIALTRIEKIKP